MRSIILILFALSAFVHLSISEEDSEDSPEIEISDGKLQGVYLKSRDGRQFSAFMGIPYANKPERFEIAEPVSPWEGTKHVNKYGSVCTQFYMFEQKIIGDEDCLFVNVFTPDTDGFLPVLVFIHGGGFQFGNSDENGPDYFMDEDVVLVTLNYRLNSLGFLSTQDEILPGNLGLKDQNLALKWVQKNIEFFGGDPSKVTLFGESAGGASVSYQILSPQSEGLFRSAACLSGTALNRWALIDDPISSAHILADKLNCPKDSSKALKDCFKQKDAVELVKAGLQENPLDIYVPFGPVVETSTRSNAFLTEHPRSLYESGKFSKIPLVITVNEDEGLLIHSGLIMKDEELRKKVDENWMDIAPSLFLYDDRGPKKISKETKDQISKALRKHYFKGAPVSQDTFQNLTDVFSDSYFIQGARKTALAHGKHAPAYTAVLGYKGTWSQLFNIGYTEVLGMTHADDLQYIFSCERYPKFPLKSQSLTASKMFVKTFTSFAATGDPNLEFIKMWEPLTEQELSSGTLNWLYVKLPLPKKMKDPLDKRMKLWDRIDRKLDEAGKRKDEL